MHNHVVDARHALRRYCSDECEQAAEVLRAFQSGPFSNLQAWRDLMAQRSKQQAKRDATTQVKLNADLARFQRELEKDQEQQLQQAWQAFGAMGLKGTP